MALPLMLLLAALPLAHIAGAQTDQSALDLAAELTVEEKQILMADARANAEHVPEHKRKPKPGGVLQAAAEASRHCTLCEYLVDALDFEAHASLAKDESLSLGWRLQENGKRATKTAAPSDFESDVGYEELVNRACAKAALGLYGLKPLKPHKRESQWQLVYAAASRFTADSPRGFTLLGDHAPQIVGKDTPDDIKAQIASAGPLRSRLDEYAEACHTVAAMYEEPLRKSLGAATRKQNPTKWFTSPSMYALKAAACQKIGTRPGGGAACAQGRRWTTNEDSVELKDLRLSPSWLQLNEDQVPASDGGAASAEKTAPRVQVSGATRAGLEHIKASAEV